MSLHCTHTTNNTICSDCLGRSEVSTLVQENTRLQGVVTERDNMILRQHAQIETMREAVRLARLVVAMSEGGGAVEETFLVDLRDALSQMEST